MLRISKIVDYGILVLTHLAARPARICSAAELADTLGLGQPVVSKVLKLLTQHGLLVSVRGARGGYRLACDATQINLVQAIDALGEQPFGLTECTSTPGVCGVEANCHVRPHWQRINRIVRTTLEAVTIAELAEDTPPAVRRVVAHAVPAASNIPHWSLSK